MTRGAAPAGAPRGVLHLIRPEALAGKEYSRLSHPHRLARVPFLAHGLITACAGVALVAAVAFLPVNNAYRTMGTILHASPSTIVRAPDAGQVTRIAAEGMHLQSGGLIASLAQVREGPGGRNPARMETEALARLAKERDVELRLVEERFALSVQSLRLTEQMERDRLASVKASEGNQALLAEQAQALVDRIAASGGGTVSRMDALAVTERSVAARNRRLELQAERVRIEATLQDLERRRRIQEIDRARELDRLERQFHAEEAASLERLAKQAFSVPAQQGGTVLAVYKQVGDWVAAGDELALLGEPAVAGDLGHVVLEVPAEIATSVRVGQQARIRARVNGASESPMSAHLVALEQRAGEGSRLRGTPGAAPGASPARSPLDPGQQALGPRQADPRVGAKVEVELILDRQRLYETLLPQRMRTSRATGSAA